ncbi:MAG: hypothetical protein SFY96_07460 [Planctomycetota bacterium]|nr:hypothetical protein [Planctomycetota bacterium]
MKRERLLNAGLSTGCLALAIFLAAGGCERRDEASIAVEKGSTTLHSISGGNVKKAPDEFIKSTMPAVAGQVKAGLDATGGTKAAASVVAAQANLNYAELALADVVEQERIAADHRLEIRRQAGIWVERGTSAGVSGSFNPADVIAKLQAEKTAKQAEIETLNKAKQDLDARLAALKSQAKAKIDQANAVLADYESKRGDLAKLSATDAARVLESTQGLKKQADTLRLEGERILAQSSVVEPDAAAKGVEIEQRRNQIASVDAAIADLTKRAATAQADAAAAQAEQQKAGEAIAKAFGELRDQREGKLREAIESSRKTINSALTTAKGAGTDGGASIKLILGKAQMLLGDLAFTEGQGASQYAALMQHLATVKPALADASRYADEAKKAQDESKETLESAGKAYEAAQSAFESTPLSGEIKERLKKVAESLGKIAGSATGASADAAAAATAPGATPEQPSSAAPAAPTGPLPEDLKAFVASLAEAAKNSDSGAVLAALNTPTPEIAEALKQVAEAGKPFERLEKVCKAKFGTTISEATGGAGGVKVDFGPDTENLAKADLAALTASVNGDKATVMSGDKKLFDAIKVNGAWKIDEPMLAQIGPQIGMMLPMISAMGSQAGALADEVEAGKYATIQDVTKAMMERMQGAMGGGPGGGPGSGHDMSK